MNKHARLKAARQAAGLNQAQLALAAGINQAQLSRMENGEKWASDSVLSNIAKELGIPVSGLFDIPGLFQTEIIQPVDSASSIKSNKKVPQGLRDLATDDDLHKAIKVQPAEWRFLATLQLPAPVNKNGYVALLTTMRSVTQS